MQQVNKKFYNQFVPESIKTEDYALCGRGNQSYHRYLRQNFVVIPGKTHPLIFKWSEETRWQQLQIYQTFKGSKQLQLQKFGAAQWPRVIPFLPMRDCFFVMGGFLPQAVGITNNAASGQNFHVNVETHRCVQRAPMPIPRYGFGACAYRDQIIVVGGLDETTQEDYGQTHLDSILECDRYLPFEDTWSPVPNLPDGRTNPSLAVIQQKLYVIGG